MEIAAYIVLGLGAGLLTTVAGLGGGLVLTLVMAAFVGPQKALALAAPALLAGNLHRIYLFRSFIDLRFVRPFLVGGVAGAVVGGLLTVALPEWVLQLLIVCALLFAIGRQFKWITWSPSARALLPMTFAVGLITATSGGGGLILGPLLLAAGARGGRFVASASIIAASIHLSRIGAYGAGGLVTSETLFGSLIIGLAITLGNAAGKKVTLSDSQRLRVTYVVLAACIAATIAGLA